jgi:hypothetical protein
MGNLIPIVLPHIIFREMLVAFCYEVLSNTLNLFEKH